MNRGSFSHLGCGILVCLAFSLFSFESHADDKSEDRAIEQVKFLINSIVKTEDIHEFIFKRAEKLMNSHYETVKSGGVDPRKWIILMSKESLLLISREEFRYKEGVVPGLEVDRVICKSHIPANGICDIAQLVAPSNELHSDPVIKGKSALFRELKYRLVLEYNRNDDLNETGPIMEVLVSHARVLSVGG